MLFSLPLELHAPALGALMAILATAGLVSGLSGFGFSAVGALILALLPPSQGVPLLMALSTANQLLSLRQLRNEMLPVANWWPDGPGPYLVGGLFGLPFGLALLTRLAPAALTMLFGALLFAYAGFSLFRPAHWRIAEGGSRTRMLVGMVGGLIGGFSALPASAVVIWLNLAGKPRVASRGTTQPFIVGMQVAGLAMLALARPEGFGSEFRGLFALCLPVVLPSTLAGVAIYRRLSDRRFGQVTLMLLGIAGVGLLGKAFVA